MNNNAVLKILFDGELINESTYFNTQDALNASESILHRHMLDTGPGCFGSKTYSEDVIYMRGYYSALATVIRYGKPVHFFLFNAFLSGTFEVDIKPESK